MGNKYDKYDKYGNKCRKRKQSAACIYGFALLCIAIVIVTCFGVFVVRVSNSDHRHHHYTDDQQEDDGGSDYGGGDHHDHGARRYMNPMAKCPFVSWRSSDASDRGMPKWIGIAHSRQGRYVQPGYMGAEYSDFGRPSPRNISNIVCRQRESTQKHDVYRSSVWSFGQFLDHIITMTRSQCGGAKLRTNVTGDEHFDPESKGAFIETDPSDFYTDEDDHRHPVNQITHSVDGNAVYGSDSERTKYLRKFKDGLLGLQNIDGKGEYPPYNLVGMENVGGRLNKSMFLVGDVRGNEQVPLLAWHILFLREHNYQARRLKQQHWDWDDECLFQAAKRIVVAEIQKVVYDEYIPALTGTMMPPTPHKYYKPGVDPRIFVEFSTAAFRFHTIVNEEIQIHSPYTGQHLETISLKDAFMNPSMMTEHGVDSVLLGLLKQKSEALDGQLVDSIRQFLFFRDGQPLDLCALNIMRGRELGLPHFSELRQQFGLPPLNSWQSLTSNAQVQEQLIQVYGENGYENLDAFVGLFVEDGEGSIKRLGRTLHKIIMDQFTRLRDGDPHYYKYDREIGYHEREYIEKTTLRKIVQRNTDIHAEHLPYDLFIDKSHG